MKSQVQGENKENEFIDFIVASGVGVVVLMGIFAAATVATLFM
ncbi:hypothetical protein [Hazenella coriacea]|uniref:YqzM-like protein n=1 Tax=Hazenella coriacea TaxID=1179467 RepID=A0A4V2UUU9_9BACL|nr:hypothetical protein [Hazenella coriacea]TCS93157.1 hypothetical protein EDD58_10999 [Hazenella coriacea]